MNTKLNHKQLGEKGESLAVQFLKEQGYRILKRNYRIKIGEIDIIAKDEDTLCFVEVKARKKEDAYFPFEVISQPKQRKISQVAACYISDHDCSDQYMRFDVVSILETQEGEAQFELIKDAFDAAFISS